MAIGIPLSLSAQQTTPSKFSFASPGAWLLLLVLLLVCMLALVLYMKARVDALRKGINASKRPADAGFIQNFIQGFNARQVDQFLQYLQQKNKARQNTSLGFLPLLAAGPPLGETGIIITIILLLIPILGGIILMMLKVTNALKHHRNKLKLEEADKLAEQLRLLNDKELRQVLAERKASLDYRLSNNELSGIHPPFDSKGLVQVNPDASLPLVAPKKKAQKRPNIDPALTKLVLWYIGCSAFWLLFGTTIGWYVGFKFVAPDADHISWLSFGRLRPVHTNAVFWGWASLAMMGLGYYIVPRVGNAPLASIKMGWQTLWLVNTAVVLGTLSLMAGINNGGGEYREYIWPVMLLFGIGLALTLINFLRTIARRKTREIYISNWYIVSSVIFAIVISLVAYIPTWQNGLGETIIQGYYMHQGVGMWFMLFTLGIVYYFLPQQLNKPIYSYSLGILAFWTQILFYTLIGTHHFVFSSIPWWLQTVAIVGSAGMVIPVIAGTTNFLMTFKGAWNLVKDSYTLPFFLVGIIFYFTGSLQGTAEAFRSTNLIWHFTDFTVAHSHLTMYGIISFFLWAAIYAVIPRLTGKEAPQIAVGAHFWLALIGMLFYTIPLMYGSTLKGMMWMDGKPFIESVSLMAPYWLWRAIGGTLMWFSHIFFAYNLYRMLSTSTSINVRDAVIESLARPQKLEHSPLETANN